MRCLGGSVDAGDGDVWRGSEVDVGGRLVVVPMPADEGADRRPVMGLKWFFYRGRGSTPARVFFGCAFLGRLMSANRVSAAPLLGGQLA